MLPLGMLGLAVLVVCAACGWLFYEASQPQLDGLSVQPGVLHPPFAPDQQSYEWFVDTQVDAGVVQGLGQEWSTQQLVLTDREQAYASTDTPSSGPWLSAKVPLSGPRELALTLKGRLQRDVALRVRRVVTVLWLRATVGPWAGCALLEDAQQGEVMFLPDESVGKSLQVDTASEAFLVPAEGPSSCGPLERWVRGDPTDLGLGCCVPKDPCASFGLEREALFADDAREAWLDTEWVTMKAPGKAAVRLGPGQSGRRGRRGLLKGELQFDHPADAALEAGEPRHVPIEVEAGLSHDRTPAPTKAQWKLQYGPPRRKELRVFWPNGDEAEVWVLGENQVPRKGLGQQRDPPQALCLGGRSEAGEILVEFALDWDEPLATEPRFRSRVVARSLAADGPAGDKPPLVDEEVKRGERVKVVVSGPISLELWIEQGRFLPHKDTLLIGDPKTEAECAARLSELAHASPRRAREALRATRLPLRLQSFQGHAHSAGRLLARAPDIPLDCGGVLEGLCSLVQTQVRQEQALDLAEKTPAMFERDQLGRRLSAGARVVFVADAQKGRQAEVVGFATAKATAKTGHPALKLRLHPTGESEEVLEFDPLGRAAPALARIPATFDLGKTLDEDEMHQVIDEADAGLSDLAAVAVAQLVLPTLCPDCWTTWPERKLVLTGWKIRGPGLEALAGLLEAAKLAPQKARVLLDVSGSPLQEASYAALGSALVDNAALVSLGLRRVGLQDAQLVALSSGLRESRLEDLDLGEGEFGTPGLEAVAEALEKMPWLTKLALDVRAESWQCQTKQCRCANRAPLQTAKLWQGLRRHFDGARSGRCKNEVCGVRDLGLSGQPLGSFEAADSPLQKAEEGLETFTTESGKALGLEALRLDSTCLTDADVKWLAPAFESSDAALKRLGLARNPLGDRGLELLLRPERLGSLEALDLADTGARANGLAALATAVGAARKLKALRVGANDFAAAHDSLGKLAKAVQGLDLDGAQNLGADHFTALGAACMDAAACTDLGLRSVGLNAAALAQLQPALQGVHRLDMARNPLQDAGAEALAKALGPDVKALSVQETELGLQGAEALAAALGGAWAASSGQLLHAGDNENLGFQGALALLGLKVKRLDLSNVGLKDEWVKDLAASPKLHTNEVLEELRLAGNGVGELACAALEKTLLNTDQVPQLRVLDVGDACPRLAEVMQNRGGKAWQDTPVLSEELFAIRA